MGERGQPFVDAATFDALVDGVSSGRYHLILGAGASAGCHNPRGQLPLADDLVRILLDEVGADPNERVGLQRAFDAAVSKMSLDYVVDLLRSLYADAEPLPWHRAVTKLPWEAIWNFNVDDVIENAYRAEALPAQRCATVLWRDPHVPFGGDLDQVQNVHLHGYVGNTDRRADHQLVFRFEDYLGALRHSARPNWHTSFRATYPTAPVIVLGARLTEELDFLEVFIEGNRSAAQGYPSVIVRPDVSDFDRAEYERWGLVVIDANADEFLGYLRDGVAALDKVSTSTGAYRSRYTDRSLVELTDDASEFDVPDGHDFYGGHEPMWQDILDERDATPKWLERLVHDIGNPRDFPVRQQLYLLLGDPFTGKSTALLRTACELRRVGWEPIYLTGRERIEVDEVSEFFRARPGALLILDDMWFDASEVAELLRRAKADNRRLVILAADRTRHGEHIRRVIPPAMLTGIEHRVFVAPTDALWMRIVAKRGKRARLGRLEGIAIGAQALHFTQHHRDLFSSLASLEDAAGFIDRGVTVYDELNPDVREAFCVVGLLARFGLPTPASVAAATTGAQIVSILTACEPGGALSEWVVVDRRTSGLLTLRHGFLGDLLVRHQVKKYGPTALFEMSIAVLTAIADRVSVRAMRQKTIEYRIAAELMDYRAVRVILGRNDVDDWYAALESLYRWNARFWEQRALALSEQLDRAYSYAKRAVSAHRDSLTLNTLGTVLMRRAADDRTAIPVTTRHTYWREGLEALVESREDGRGRFEHPYTTFFFYTAKVLQFVPLDDLEWLTQMQQAFREWRISAESQSLAAEQQLRELTEEFPEEWRK